MTMPPAPAPSIAERYHALDALRAAAMLLGILLHGAMSFVEPPIPVWPAVDQSRSPVIGGFVLLAHAFRLQVFFVMAGFFAHLVVQRSGVRGFVGHRLRRIVIPLALSVVTLIPLTQMLFVIGLSRLDGPATILVEGKTVDFSAYQCEVREFFGTGRFVSRFLWFHLWFLWYLVVIYVIWLIVLPMVRWLERRAWFNASFRWVIRSAAQPLLLALPTAVLMMPMLTWQVDSPTRVLPEWRIVGYYLAFFAYGWLLFRHRDLLAAATRHWRWHLLLATFAVFPLLGWIFLHAPLVVKQADPDFWLPAIGTYSLLTWPYVLGMLGAFQWCFAQPSAKLRYLADSAYWLYLAHLPLVIGLQMLVVDWPGGVLLKFGLMNIAAVAMLLASYEWGVRYTWIGRMLHGRRGRLPRDVPSREVMEENRGRAGDVD